MLDRIWPGMENPSPGKHRDAIGMCKRGRPDPPGHPVFPNKPESQEQVSGGDTMCTWWCARKWWAVRM